MTPVMKIFKVTVHQKMKQFLLPTAFPPSYYKSQWLPARILCLTFFRNIFFCVQRKKETRTGLEQEGE